MENITKTFPMGVGGLSRGTTPDYTEVNVAHLGEDFIDIEKDVVEWLENLEHSSWFAWERPRGLMIFENNTVAYLFILRWLLCYTISQRKEHRLGYI